MRGKLRQVDLISQGRRQKEVILVVLAFSVSLALVLRIPELSALVISLLTKLLQYVETNGHLDVALFLRYQDGILQNLPTQFLARGELASFEIRPRSLPFGMKIRYVLMVAATDISVIIPTLNEEKYLPSCLKSLAHQSYTGDYEVIVVDGGSTDRTLDVAKNFADHVLSFPKRSVGAARNKGAKTGKGRIVAFIDADTIASEYWLSAIEQGFNGRGIIGVTGPTLPHNGEILDTITYRLWTMYLQRILLSAGMPHVIGFNCAYRKDLFVKVGGFDEKSVLSEDIRLALKMRRHGRIAFEKHMSALTSPRRFRRYGHAYIAGLYFVNGFSTLLINKSSRNYPPVR